MSTPTKPTFKVPDKGPPLKPPPDMMEAPSPAAPKAEATSPTAWQLIATAPTDEAARFMVRACVGGKPVPGTETIVRYRVTRKRVGRKWAPSLTIIDDRLETKLGFRPTEWKKLDA
jgi:hypothetical protein